MKLLSLRSLLRRLPPRGRAVAQTCVYGLGAGAATVAFQLGITWLYPATLVPLSAQPRTTLLLGGMASPGAPHWSEVGFVPKLPVFEVQWL